MRPWQQQAAQPLVTAMRFPLWIGTITAVGIHRCELMPEIPSDRVIRLLAGDGRLATATHARGVPDVRVCSAPEAARLRPSRRGVVIAIRDPGAAPIALRPGWRAVLALEVPDVDSLGDLAPTVDLGPTGDAIAAFVVEHHDAVRVVLHCHLGVSRSRSAAAAICDAFKWPYRWTALHEPLYAAVREALERRMRHA
jgi:predicted protein tyrosine phosphatase